MASEGSSLKVEEKTVGFRMTDVAENKRRTRVKGSVDVRARRSYIPLKVGLNHRSRVRHGCKTMFVSDSGIRVRRSVM